MNRLLLAFLFVAFALALPALLAGAVVAWVVALAIALPVLLAALLASAWLGRRRCDR